MRILYTEAVAPDLTACTWCGGRLPDARNLMAIFGESNVDLAGYEGKAVRGIIESAWNRTVQILVHDAVSNAGADNCNVSVGPLCSQKCADVIERFLARDEALGNRNASD